MNKLVLAALLISASAFASKARLSALGFGMDTSGTSAVMSYTSDWTHLKDAQSVFQNPAHMHALGDWATFEMGSETTSATTGDAEGGFVKSMGDAKYGFYLGRKSAFTTSLRAAAGFLGQENPFEVMYAWNQGDMKMGASFNYSSSDVKSSTTAQKQNAMGVRIGAETDMWDASFIMGLGSSATGTTGAVVAPLTTLIPAADEDLKYTGTTGLRLNGGYNMDNMKIYADYYQDGAKIDTSTEFKKEISNITVGMINTFKAEGSNFFYGVAYNMYTDKTETSTESKTTATSLPFHIGIEADAASWLTLRGSVKQNVLLGSKKVGDADADTVTNNQVVGAGVGIKFNKFMLDASLQAAGTGKINTSDDKFLTDASLTYTF